MHFIKPYRTLASLWPNSVGNTILFISIPFTFLLDFLHCFLSAFSFHPSLKGSFLFGNFYSLQVISSYCISHCTTSLATYQLICIYIYQYIYLYLYIVIHRNVFLSWICICVCVCIRKDLCQQPPCCYRDASKLSSFTNQPPTGVYAPTAHHTAATTHTHTYTHLHTRRWSNLHL